MKQFKNAVAVAIAAAGLYSVSAMAGTAVHWAGSDAGSAKDVKWKVVQPSRLDFTFTTRSITKVASDGTVNADNPGEQGGAGSWENKGDAITVSAEQLESGNHTQGIALGNSTGQKERLLFWVKSSAGDLNLDGTKPWPSHDSGTISAMLEQYLLNQWVPITSMNMKSTRFADTLTVTKYTV